MGIRYKLASEHQILERSEFYILRMRWGGVLHPGAVLPQVNLRVTGMRFNRKFATWYAILILYRPIQCVTPGAALSPYLRKT